jgi:hypothetical protein
MFVGERCSFLLRSVALSDVVFTDDQPVARVLHARSLRRADHEMCRRDLEILVSHVHFGCVIR